LTPTRESARTFAGLQQAQPARVAALSARTIPVGRQLLRRVALAVAVLK
jgi:hypothetical protein